ncbi:MAG: hypothetical protein R2713_03950 [Ilumatobacteraceae bacterium]
MSPRPLVVDAELTRIAAHSTPPDTVQHQLIAATRDRTGGAAGMQIGGDQGLLFEMLVRAMGVRRDRDRHVHGLLGAEHRRGLPPDGRLLCCDVSEE